MDALAFHRFQFAFTITFHYLFPQLTMGLALLIVLFKYFGTYRNVPFANDAARFFSRIFALNFVMGVVTGIPMEFQFGANWSRFSEVTGGVIGTTLAMEGLFAFFLESSFLYVLLYGEKKFSPRVHFLSAVLVCLGSWVSGYFIIVTNAFMQHPTGHVVLESGHLRIQSLGAYLTNPWALVQYAHTMVGSVITASFVVTAVGAYFTLIKKHDGVARIAMRFGVIAGLVATIASAMPTGDLQAKMVATHQPVTFAAMEGHFHTEDGASMVLIGQPDMEKLRLDNPIRVPNMLSFMTHHRWNTRIEGLTSFDRSQWPDQVPLLYFSYHIMVGLGTVMMGLMALAAWLTFRKRLSTNRPLLWILMIAFPMPYIANTAGWMTSELGRQPWLVHGLVRTKDGASPHVASGNVLFTLLGYMGIYAMLALLFAILMLRILAKGPVAPAEAAPEGAASDPVASAEPAPAADPEETLRSKD